MKIKYWATKATLEDERVTRATMANIVPETARSTLAQATFNNANNCQEIVEFDSY